MFILQPLITFKFLNVNERESFVLRERFCWFCYLIVLEKMSRSPYLALDLLTFMWVMCGQFIHDL